MHQEFCDWWYGEPNDLAPPSSYPYVLRLGLPTDRSTLPFGPETISDNQILVTESYELMFLRLLHLRESDKGQTRGAVLTGQPGIGESPGSDPHPVRQLTGASALQEKLPF